MKVALIVVLAVLVVVFATVVLFRSTRIDLPAPPSRAALPEDLDAYLVDAEARFDDLVPGTGKTITWYDPAARERTPLSVVALHGFSASRQETAPLAAEVARVLGANLFETRLQGHGRDGAAMAEASVRGWLADTREAIEIGRRLGERVVLIGVSTGGSLVLWAATRPELRSDLAALVLISPNLGPRDGKAALFLWPGGPTIARWIFGPERVWEPQNEAHARYWTERYPIGALQPMMRLVAGVRRLPMEEIDVPTVLFHSERDEVVGVEAARDAFDRLGTTRKERHVIDPGDADGHVLAGDVLSPGTTDAVVRAVVRFVEGE